GGDEDGAGAFEELQADRPAAALAELIVQKLEQGGRAGLFAGAHECAGNAHEVVEIRRVFLELSQPLAFERVEVALRQLVLCCACDRHRGASRYHEGPGAFLLFSLFSRSGGGRWEKRAGVMR